MSLTENKNAKINKEYKPSEREQDVRKHVYKRYNEMKDAPERQRAEGIAERSEKAWEAYRSDKTEDDWQSNYYIPLTTSVVESILSEMVDQRLRPMVLPRGSDDIDRARLMNHIFDYTWDVSNGDVMLSDVLRSTLIRGTGFAQEYYLKDRRMIQDIISLDKASKNTWTMKTEEKEVYEYDDIMAEEVSFWDIFVDEKAREFNFGPYKARDAIRRYVMHYEDAKNFFKGPIWDPMNNFRFVKPGGNTDYYQFYKPPQGANTGEDVEILWYWGRIPEDALFIVINDVVMRVGPNIFKHKQIPFCKSVDVKRVGQFYGKGEPELLDSIQEELNTLRRMTIDRHHLDIDKSFIMDPQSTTINDEDLISRPHGVIPGDPKSIQAIEYGDIPTSVQLTFKSINEDSVRVTGIDDRFQALQKTPSTATEAAILKESTLKRIRMKVFNMEKGFLTDLGRMRIANILQFYSQPKIQKILGEKDSAEYQQALSSAMLDGSLEVRNGQAYQKKYREIRLKDINLFTDERGKLKEAQQPGVNFFELKPEYFIPLSTGGFDFKIEVGPTMPVSKPLMQDKINQMVQTVIPFADGRLTTYSPEKILDELFRSMDLDPQNFKTKEEEQQGGTDAARLQLAMDLASQENEEIVKGGTIPVNGTPYAPPPHTEAHIAFLRSDQMKSAPEEIYRALVKHTMGEVVAILTRSGGAGLTAPEQGGQQPGSVSLPAQSNGQQLKSILPNKIQGGGEVPTGRALGNG